MKAQYSPFYLNIRSINRKAQKIYIGAYPSLDNQS